MNEASELRIRPAVPGDAAQLDYWDEKPHVRAAASNDGRVAFDCDWEEELGPRTDGTEFFIAEIDSLPIGALQIIDPAIERSHYWGALSEHLRAIDIWIGEESFLGSGYGTRMMGFAIERCFNSPEVRAIVIDPLANNLQAHRFYRRLGFEFVERRVFDENSDCHVFRLERAAWEASARQQPVSDN